MSTTTGKIQYITDENNGIVLPVTHERGVVDSSGVNLETKLAAKQATISTVNVSVDNNTGTPSGTASVSGNTLSLSFSNLKGATGATGATGPTGPQGPVGPQGNTGSSVSYPYELINNLTTDDATKGLSAAQGVTLKGQINQLGLKVNPIADNFTFSANLFDKSTATSGTAISKNNGATFTPTGSFVASDYIAIPAGTTNIIYTPQSYTGSSGWAIYNSSKTFIRGGNQPFSIPISSGEAYIRISVNTDNADTTMMVTGTVLPSTYVPAGYHATPNFPAGSIGTTSLADKAVTKDKLSWDVQREMDNYYQSFLKLSSIEETPYETGGYIVTNVGVGNTVTLTKTGQADWEYFIVDVTPGMIVTISGRGGNGSRLWAFLDADNKLLSISDSGLTATGLQVTAPTNAAKVVINSNKTLYPQTSVAISLSNNTIDRILAQLPTSRQIKILVIGNSFSYRSMAQTNASLLAICANMGVKAHIEIVGNSGASFDSLYTSFQNNTACAYHWDGTDNGGWSDDGGDNITIRAALQSEEWDYVFFHQASADSGNYTTFSPGLANLIRASKMECSNEHLKIGLMLTWAYANNTGTYPNATTGFATQAAFYAAICSAYEQAMDDYKIDVLVPAGTAIQNARGTSLDSAFSDFAAGSDDAVHINAEGGVITALAWFSSIWGDLFDISIMDVANFTSLYTDAQFAIAQKCASAAIKFPFEVTEIS